MTNGERILEQIKQSTSDMQFSSWTDENGAYHDSGWNDSWPDGWRDSH